MPRRWGFGHDIDYYVIQVVGFQEQDKVLALNENGVLAPCLVLPWQLILNDLILWNWVECKVFYVWIYLCIRGLNNIFEAKNQL